MIDTRDAFCPDNLDRFTVLRTTSTTNDFGETVLTPTPLPARGVVTTGRPNQLERGPDEQHGTKSITIVTRFRLQLASPGFDADGIEWHDDTFVVVEIDDYTAYGPGFIQAVAESVGYLEEPPPAEA